MCNELHTGHEKIPAEGKGFKIFSPNNTALFTVRGLHREVYETDKDGWIAWNRRKPAWEKDITGFCIFLSFMVAEECSRRLISNSGIDGHILPIEYKQGLGKHMESRIVRGEYEIAIVKQFRIIVEKDKTKG